MAYNTRNSMGIKQETVSQLRNEVFTFRIATQHALKKYNFVLLTFWSIGKCCEVHFFHLRKYITLCTQSV